MYEIQRCNRQMEQNVIYGELDIFLLDRTANKSGELPFTSTQSLSALSTIDSP